MRPNFEHALASFPFEPELGTPDELLERDGASAALWASWQS
jgi:hypothetical protein